MKKAVVKKEKSFKKLEEISESMGTRIINGLTRRGLWWLNGRG